jgi:hypothetical protein
LKLEQAAERIATLAVEQAQKACDDDDISWTDLLEQCSEIVAAQRFGPQGGAYHERQWAGYHNHWRSCHWAGYHTPGFTQPSDKLIPGE